MKKLPESSIELIEELNKDFPLRLPSNINFTIQEVAYIMGQRSVIDHLEFLVKAKDKKEGTIYESE